MAESEVVLGEVVAMIGEVVGEDMVAGTGVGRDTLFGEDLELESIEFVALAELVQDRFGESVDLVAWTGHMDLDQIMGLTVGQLVDFVAASA